MTAPRKLKVITCPSLRPELEQLAATCNSEISFQCLDMALHECSPAALHNALQTAIDGIVDDNEAIAVGYGVCNRGIIGIAARDIPLVIPRAHDCIGLLLGSNQRYLAELDAEPGTYFQSAGWLLAAAEGAEHQAGFIFGPNTNANFERLAARYGTEPARYLVQELEGLTKYYRRLAFIATAVPASGTKEREARDIAAHRGLQYRRLEGDTGWLRRLMEGIWPADEFLIVQPGQRVVAADGKRLIEAS